MWLRACADHPITPRDAVFMACICLQASQSDERGAVRQESADPVKPYSNNGDSYRGCSAPMQSFPFKLPAWRLTTQCCSPSFIFVRRAVTWRGIIALAIGHSVTSPPHYFKLPRCKLQHLSLGFPRHPEQAPEYTCQKGGRLSARITNLSKMEKQPNPHSSENTKMQDKPPVIEVTHYNSDNTSEDGCSNGVPVTPPLRLKVISTLLVCLMGFGTYYNHGVLGAVKTPLKKVSIRPNPPAFPILTTDSQAMHIDNTQFSLILCTQDLAIALLMPFSGLVTDYIGGAGKPPLHPAPPLSKH